MALIEYSVRQGDNGKWRIDTAELKGNVRHSGVMPEEFDTKDDAEAAIELLLATEERDLAPRHGRSYMKLRAA